MQVLAQGDITVYERSGQYQLTVSQLQPTGMGALQLAFEQLKQKLAAEGIFEESLKKPLPEYPENIGIVTSPTGAAIRDIAQVIGRRYPGVRLVLRPVNVQGKGASTEIAQAIQEFNEYGQVDVLIVGRGGGSLEDLWAFNEEVVARAIAASNIPIISAVGHEIDFTIADFVADQRAPTPSAAAEMVVKDRSERLKYVEGLYQGIIDSMTRKLEDAQQTVDHLRSNYIFRSFAAQVQQRAQQVDEWEGRLLRGYEHMLSTKTARLQELAGALNALSPLSTLKRGYSIVYKLPGRSVVRTAQELNVHDEIEITFASGKAFCKVEHINETDLF
jgi:exodeoxyribonuclease VII large subunit